MYHVDSCLQAFLGKCKLQCFQTLEQEDSKRRAVHDPTLDSAEVCCF